MCVFVSKCNILSNYCVCINKIFEVKILYTVTAGSSHPTTEHTAIRVTRRDVLLEEEQREEQQPPLSALCGPGEPRGGKNTQRIRNVQVRFFEFKPRLYGLLALKV